MAKEEREKYEAEKHLYFEQPGSLVSPAGLLKVEGTWQSAVFRGVKIYHLEKFSDDAQAAPSLNKAKGVPGHIVKKLKTEHFEAQGKGDLYTSVGLGPTEGGQMALTVRSRHMGSFLNSKRTMHKVTCVDSGAIIVCYHTTVFSQDRCHTSGFD